MKEATVVTAKNGGMYQIVDDENKKVKKLKVDAAFVQNDTIESLDGEIEYANTECLYRLLKSEIGEGVQWSKRGFVKYKGFKILYSSHGFRVEDTLNFGEVVNINEFHNDMPYPADVLEWLRKHSDRAIKPPKMDEEKVKVITALSEKFIVTTNGKVKVTEKPRDAALKQKEDEKEKVIQSARETRINNAIEKFKIAFKADAKIKELKELAKKVSQKREFLKAIDSLLFQYKRSKIDARKFNKLFKELTTPLLEPKPEKQVKPPKFVGIPLLWEPVNPVFGSKLKMTFTQKDESKKGGYTIETTVPTYMAHVVLFNFPKAMPLLMKVCKGEEVNIQDVDLEQFIKDPFEVFDKALLSNSATQIELLKWCTEILEFHSITTALDYVFNPEYKKGTKVRVFWPDYHTWFRGEVVSNDSGVKIRYEDGSVEYLLSHQKIEKL